MAEVIINGQAYEFNDGESILDVAQRNNIDIPVMCYLKHITPTGACRLCLVEVEGLCKPVAACVTYAIDGMKVKTDTEDVIFHRKQMMDFILMKHPLDCPVCDKAGECMLQDTAYEFGITEETAKVEKPKKEIKVWNKILHNENLCILCERCVKICHEITAQSAYKIEERGFNNFITTTDPAGLNCDFCGLCVDYCPVGALLDVPFNHKMRVWDLKNTLSTCSYCPSGCKLKFGTHENKIERVTSKEDGFICTLGRNGYKYIDSEDRITTPLISGAESNWDDVKEQLSSVDKDSLAVVIGSRLSNESIYAYKSLTNKIVADLELTDKGFYEKYEAKFGTKNNIGNYMSLATSEFVFVIGADLGREVTGTKWRVMTAVAKNKGNMVVIGLNDYEIDKYAKVRMNADYGDFASKINEFLTSDNELIAEARKLFNRAKKVSIVVGNEYLSAEDNKDAVLSLADEIGKERLGAFFVLNDKANYQGILASGIVDNGYSPEDLIKDIESDKVKTVIAADYYPYATTELEKKLESALSKVDVISVDFLSNKFNKNSKFVLPVTIAYEQDGTTTTVDNRIGIRKTVVTPPADVKTDVQIASFIGSLIGVDIPDTNEEIWNTYIKGQNSYPDFEYSKLPEFQFRKADIKFENTSYEFKSAGNSTKEIYINAKYQNGFISTKANIVEQDEDGGKREYFFDADLRAIAGKGVKAPTNAVVKEDIAKGIVLIPKNK